MTKLSSNLALLITHDVIEQAVIRLAAQISADYRERQLVAVGVLKGAFIFMADLVRRLDIPVQVDFLMASSYGNATVSSCAVRLERDLSINIQGKDVLIVEDIVDTGHTARCLLQLFATRGTSSVRLCALADKPARRQVDVKLDYVGFTVPDQFVVGYGLDFDNDFRGLPDIYVLEEHAANQ